MSELVTTEDKPNRSLTEAFAGKYGVDADKMLHTLTQTAFRGAKITTEQMMALIVVADQYNLNPFTKEIYAFPDKGAIIPVVSVDGWSRIMNSNPEMDGIEFEYSPETVDHHGKKCHEWIDCLIYRKDRSRPIKVREYFDEVKKDSGPWKSHPNRMHRHKTEIQCARIAFGFAGIYDHDEAERIAESFNVVDVTPVEVDNTFNDEQSAFYHQLIKDDNGIEFYVYMTTLPEIVRNDLHNSWPKGHKVKGKDTANALYVKGREEYEKYTHIFATALTEGDTVTIQECASELSEQTIEYLSKELGDEFSSVIMELKKCEE
jgi:phage recombination protein Bet